MSELAEKLRQRIEAERAYCKWDSANFIASPAVYVRREFLSFFSETITAIETLEQAVTAAQRLAGASAEDAAEELRKRQAMEMRVVTLQGAVRTSTEMLDQAQERNAELLLALKALRALHSGKVLTIEEHGRVLKEVDAVLEKAQ